MSPQEDVVNNLLPAALHLIDMRTVSSPPCPDINVVIPTSTRYPSLFCTPLQSTTGSHQPPAAGKSFGKCHKESRWRQGTRKGTLTCCENKYFINLIVAVRRGKRRTCSPTYFSLFIFGLFMSQPVGRVANFRKTDTAQ